MSDWLSALEVPFYALLDVALDLPPALLAIGSLVIAVVLLAR